ncbi:MAG: type II toxin-antitoxin system VapC family toxin [Burkholderiaceae bacterium]|nr:type II toxin-antitoxin system VapC family toxin [Burkholderiaceae bacterium]
MGGLVNGLLLDTHALLWWFTDDPRLSANARAAIADEHRPILVSAASAWEIATKHRLGKLEGIPEILSLYGELIVADGFTHLPVSWLHGLRAGSYAIDHRDPFDRMLAAQAEIERLVLVTRDPAFRKFGCPTLW